MRNGAPERRTRERTVGAIYQPEDRWETRYLQAAPSARYDELVWFEESRAVTPLETEAVEGEPGTYPSGL